MRKSDCESKILNSVRSISALAWKVFRGSAVRTVRCGLTIFVTNSEVQYDIMEKTVPGREPYGRDSL